MMDAISESRMIRATDAYRTASTRAAREAGARTSSPGEQATARVRTREFGFKLGGFGFTYTAREMELDEPAAEAFGRGVNGKQANQGETTARASIAASTTPSIASPIASSIASSIASGSAVVTYRVPSGSLASSATSSADTSPTARRALAAYARAAHAPEEEAVPLSSLLSVV